ncbi:hypothetical protein ACHAW6_009172 [Cyclotella cf. meneghiniana]
MVMVDIDSSGILIEPLKSRKDTNINKAYTNLMQYLKTGIQPRKHVLDNEVSQAMKDLIKNTYNMELENFKSIFLSILAGTADNFPLQIWDKFLLQAEISINFLRQSNATPIIPAYAHLNGPFDNNKRPLAPLGCNMQGHEKTDTSRTWA